ncbi:FdtA/QdtA family cupin domain-containing protein [Desulfoscipio sp. XC116]|uniref:sugar 3,4-ketoisomerase n=1 Tax=Desulfoscipio sp. XC116 TaxID=3144975 RepID=UPI00325B352E
MDIQIIKFRLHSDIRGGLIAVEQLKDIPFEIKRIYYIFDVTEGTRRGFHAHKKLRQVMFCPHGSCKIMLDDGTEKAEVLLDSPDKGLLVNSNIWREIFDFSQGTVLMVLASDYYNECDYIRDYGEFLSSLKNII